MSTTNSDSVKPVFRLTLSELAQLLLTENSETQLGKDAKYKMFVRAFSRETDEELAQLVSESFIVGQLS